jgi:hypothetical protein
MLMKPSSTAVFASGSSSSSRSRGGGGCRRRIGGGSTRIRRTTAKKTTATTTTNTGAALIDAKRQHFKIVGNNDITTTTGPAAKNDAEDNDANDSDEDNNSYLLPRTLFQDSPPSSSSPRGDYSPNKCRNEMTKMKSGRNRVPDESNNNNHVKYEFKIHDVCSPNEVVAVTPVSTPLSVSKNSEKGSKHYQSKSKNYFDSVDKNNNITNITTTTDDNDQASILSELSNLSTPSANHRRIIHNSHKLACHILHNPPSEATSKTKPAAAATTTPTTPSLPTNDTVVQYHPLPASVLVPITPMGGGAMIPLKNDPEFSLYFRMLRYGFTMNAVRAALRKDGKPDITRLDPERPVDRQKMPRVTTTTTTTVGLEIVNEHGLTDRGWEMALESARKALDEKKTNNNTISTTAWSNKSPANKKSKKATKVAAMTTRGDYYYNSAAVGNSPPWLLNRKSTTTTTTTTTTPTTTSASEHHGCGRNNSGILFEGWLHKRTRHGRWVKRWYLIDSSGIYYTHSPPPSSPSSSSSSGGKKIKYIKLVDARSLLLCAKNIHSPYNPMEFELYHQQPLAPSSSSSSSSSSIPSPSSALSRKRVLATLKASSAAELEMWMDAIDCVCERQRLVDEVVVGSSASADVMVLARECSTASNSNDVGYRNADLTTNAICKGTTCPMEPSFTKNHPSTQPNLLKSRNTLETLASSSDDSLDVFEEKCDGHHNNISRQYIEADDLMKAVDDLTKLSTSQRGRKWSCEPSKPLCTDLRQSEDDPMDVGNNEKLVKIGAEFGTEKDGSKEAVDGEPKLKFDPKYQKYYAMMKMGLPKQVAQHAMKRDQLDPRYVLAATSLVPCFYCHFTWEKTSLFNVDPTTSLYLFYSILDLDQEKSLKSQRTPKGGNCVDEVGLPLQDDPQYCE